MPSAAKSQELTLIIVRHSQAEDPGTFAASGAPDCERPLSSHGVKRMKRAARGLRALVDGVDRILTSPCLRAEHTARILAGELGYGSVETIDELAPGADPAVLARLLEAAIGDGVVILVGHEPDLSRLISWFCVGNVTQLVEMKTGTACAVRFQGPPGQGQGTLIWLLNQAQLRKL